MLCQGPLTKWGGYNSTWPAGGYTTQLDIYLDTAYATANPDTYGGNMACLLPPGDATDPTCKGTRFDYSSAINNTSGAHLRDFGFNVSTGLAGDDCSGFTVLGTTNVDRIGANPNLPGHQCIETSGWYTFKHTFSEENGFLKVLMEIIPAGGGAATASWTITGIDPIGTVGCNRYGWFTNQEIWGLPIDNASMTGCGTPPPVVVEPPPVIVLPPTPQPQPPIPPEPPSPRAGCSSRTACYPEPPVTPEPPDQEVGNEIITTGARSCIIEVRSLGPSQVLIARGAARAPAGGTGRLIVRINVLPRGKKLLSENFGGVSANVRALCRSTSGTLHRAVKRVRVMLLVEHRLTPPGSWVPDQPILTDIGHNFMNQLRVACSGSGPSGATATRPRTRPARPSRRCSRSTGRNGSARSWIVSEASTPAFGSSRTAAAIPSRPTATRPAAVSTAASSSPSSTSSSSVPERDAAADYWGCLMRRSLNLDAGESCFQLAGL